jgi:molybdopterin synthase catalytic subunit
VQLANHRIQVSLTRETLQEPLPFGSSECGAEVRFRGVVRGNEDGRRIKGIDYSAYEPMALASLESIVAAFQESVGAHSVVVEHRIGFVASGEPSIVIALAQPHSQGAFDLLASYLHRVKKEAPIWKRPVFETRD